MVQIGFDAYAWIDCKFNIAKEHERAEKYVKFEINYSSIF